MEILDRHNKPLCSEWQSVKARLAQVYTNELEALTEQDLEDFCKWFLNAGYPTYLGLSGAGATNER